MAIHITNHDDGGIHCNGVLQGVVSLNLISGILNFQCSISLYLYKHIVAARKGALSC